jgi:hypothetical protein
MLQFETIRNYARAQYKRSIATCILTLRVCLLRACSKYECSYYALNQSKLGLLMR